MINSRNAMFKKNALFCAVQQAALILTLQVHMVFVESIFTKKVPMLEDYDVTIENYNKLYQINFRRPLFTARCTPGSGGYYAAPPPFRSLPESPGQFAPTACITWAWKPA